MKEEVEDITQRDDIIIFSEALSKSNHNIKNLKNYRKFQQDLVTRNQPGFRSTDYTQTASITGYIGTIDNSDRFAQQDEQDRMRINLNGVPLRRNSVTAGNTRRKRNIDTSKTQARTLHLSNHIGFRESEQITHKLSKPKQNRFSSIERRHNKGPMKDKYLACWLNSLLLEACQSEKFDSTLENPALKKYGLDENSLRSKGIKPENLIRIYKSLFVYSIGFNDLLKEICENNMNLRKTIWKVFAVLLEYCAEGEFESMIVQIERDRLEKVEALSQKLREKQELIENIDDINEKKNLKLFKENDQLKERNKQLQNEKAVLLEQFKQAEQSFNQQVSLRLRYQNKINEIHGVYIDVQNKHNRLLNDHQIMTKQLEKLKIQTTSQTKVVFDLKRENEQKIAEIEKLRKDLKYKVELVGQLENRKHGDAHINIENMVIIKDLKSIVEQKSRQVSQLYLSLNNANLLLENEKKDHEKTGELYAASLQENGRLHITIRDQMKQLNDLLLEKRDFGLETSNIKAEILLQITKYEQKAKQVTELQQALVEEQNRTKKLKVDVQIEKKVKEQLEMDLSLCYKNIQEMKVSKNVIEEQFIQLRRKMDMIDGILAEKDHKIQQGIEKIQNLSVELGEKKTTISSLQSKLEILFQQFKIDESVLSRKVNSLKGERDEFQRCIVEFEHIRKLLENERDNYKERFEMKEQELKNEKFEKTQLKSFYDYSLLSGEEKNEEIKRLDMKISEKDEEIAEAKRKLKSQDYIFSEKEKKLRKQIEFWNNKANSMIKEIKERKMFINPMIYEDVCASFHNKEASLTKLTEKYNQKVQEITKIGKVHQEKQMQLIFKYENETIGISKKYQKIIEKKDHELLYEVNKNVYLQERIKELESDLENHTGTTKLMTQEREEKYIADINHKRQKIEELIKEVEKVQEANSTLRQEYHHIEEAVAQKDKELAEKEQEVEEIKDKLTKIIEEKSEELKQIKMKIEKNEKYQMQDFEEDEDVRPESKTNNGKQERINDRVRVNSRFKQSEKSRGSQKLRETSREKQKSREREREWEGKSKSKLTVRQGTIQRGDEAAPGKKGRGFDQTQRSDIAKKIKGAYMYYAR